MRNEDETLQVATYRAALLTALERVADQMDCIEVAGTLELDDDDEPRRRVGLALSHSTLYLARFLAVMEAELMPASLKLWNYAENAGRRNATLQARLDRMARRYLEARINDLLYEELNRLHARVTEEALDSGKAV